MLFCFLEFFIWGSSNEHIRWALYGIGSYFSIQKRIEVAENRFAYDFEDLKNNFIKSANELDLKIESFKKEQAINKSDIYDLYSKTFELFAGEFYLKNYFNHYTEGILLSIRYKCYSILDNPNNNEEIVKLDIENIQNILSHLIEICSTSNERITIKKRLFESTCESIINLSNQPLIESIYKLKQKIDLVERN